MREEEGEDGRQKREKWPEGEGDSVWWWWWSVGDDGGGGTDWPEMWRRLEGSHRGSDMEEEEEWHKPWFLISLFYINLLK